MKRRDPNVTLDELVRVYRLARWVTIARVVREVAWTLGVVLWVVLIAVLWASR